MVGSALNSTEEEGYVSSGGRCIVVSIPALYLLGHWFDPPHHIVTLFDDFCGLRELPHTNQ